MSLLALILLQAPQALPSAPPQPQPAAPPLVRTIPTNWDELAPLPWREPPQLTPDLTAFVADEVRARRCRKARVEGRRVSLPVEVAVMVRETGTVRTAVPRAIDCPTVEQFAAGLVTSFARNNLRNPAPGWYRVTVTFNWSR